MKVQARVEDLGGRSKSVWVSKRGHVGDAEFRWPQDVRICFADGETYCAAGSFDRSGPLHPSDGKITAGSPCHEALVMAGYSLEPA